MSGPIEGAPPPSRGPVERGGGHWWQRHADEEAAGRFCPRCAGEFLPEIEACPDCGVALVASLPEEPETPMRSDRHDIVEYDLAAWSNEQRDELVEQLGIEHIVHEWSGSNLQIPGAAEAKVDELIDAIDELVNIPDDVEYEFAEWTSEQRDELVARLQARDLVFRWDGLTLGISAADEAVVDGVVLEIDPTFPITS